LVSGAEEEGRREGKKENARSGEKRRERHDRVGSGTGGASVFSSSQVRCSGRREKEREKEGIGGGAAL